MEEKIVETKVCKQCQSSFDITDKDLEFYDKISPVIKGKKYQIPAPRTCPECRRQLRLLQQNARKLYKWKSDLSGKSLISLYSPDKKFQVYTPEEWLSEDRDFLMYGKYIDLDSPFFPQFHALYERVPKRNIILWGWSENCDYVNGVGGSKDSYLIFDSTNAMSCYYSNSVNFDQSCVDCSYVKDSENCYMGIDCNNCFNAYYCQDCTNCSEAHYLFNCTNAHNCFACYNLNNADYHIFNKAYSKEEYEVEKNKLLGKFTMKDFLEFKKNGIVKNLNIVNSENAIGDQIYNAQNVRYSYGIADSQNIAYSTMLINNAADCYDVDFVGNGISQVCDASLINKSSSKVYFTYDTRGWSENVFYSISCKSCKNIFFCNGLLNKEYCILNKQYTKEEYEELVSQIIERMIQRGEWGEFIPPSLSPFGYNESVAMDRFPLTEEEAVKKWFNRSDYEAPFPQAEKILKANELPNIQDATDEILQQAIQCEVSKKPFRIIKPELEFYRKHHLPLPTKHHDIRHMERMRLRNPRKLRDRTCMKCWIDIKTTYSPERTEIVYCENCYNKEIYG